MVKPLSTEILLTQGMCCGNMCANCPYLPRWEFLSTEEHSDWIAFSTALPDSSYEDFLELQAEKI